MREKQRRLACSGCDFCAQKASAAALVTLPSSIPQRRAFPHSNFSGERMDRNPVRQSRRGFMGIVGVATAITACCCGGVSKALGQQNNGVPGNAKSSKSKMLAMGADVLQSRAPINAINMPGRSVETPPLMVAQIPPPCAAGLMVLFSCFSISAQAFQRLP